HFLFGDLTGYCVHFAHAAVFLMRAVGVPARVGTGYALPEANRQGGSALLLRNSDQHAWPEVYLGPGEPMPSPAQTAVDAFVAMRDEGMLDFLPGRLAEQLVEAIEETARAEPASVPPPSLDGEVSGLYAEAR